MININTGGIFMKKIIKKLIYKESNKISVSKVSIWIAGILTAVLELNAQLIAAGITIPHELIPVFKVAAVASAVIAGIRLRDATSKSSQKVNITSSTSTQS